MMVNSTKELLGIDMGAMPKDFDRPLTLDMHNCKGESIPATLLPNDWITFHSCKWLTRLSWEGILEWDGRRLNVIKRTGLWRHICNKLM